MQTHSEFLNKARNAANEAFEEHCKQWDLLQKITEPTIDDLEKWLSTRDTFFKLQAEFENIVRQISISHY